MAPILCYLFCMSRFLIRDSYLFLSLFGKALDELMRAYAFRLLYLLLLSVWLLDSIVTYILSSGTRIRKFTFMSVLIPILPHVGTSPDVFEAMFMESGAVKKTRSLAFYFNFIRDLSRDSPGVACALLVSKCQYEYYQ
jgi:hypothetical protein